MNVGAGAHPFFNRAVGAPARHRPRVVPAVGVCRRVPDPGLEVDRARAGEHVAPQCLQGLAIVGVDGRHPAPAGVAGGVLTGARLPRLLRRGEAAGGVGGPDDGHRRVHQRAVAALAGAQPMLGRVALGNVLDDRDHPFEPALIVEQRRHRHVHPDGRATGRHVALVDGDFVERASRYLLDQAGVRRPVVGMRDLLTGESDALVDRAADDVGHALVHPCQPSVERQQRHAERGLAEHRFEPRSLPPRLAARGLAGAGERGDERGDAGEDGRLRELGQSPAGRRGQREVGVDAGNPQGERQQRRTEPAEPRRQDDGGKRRRIGPCLRERQADRDPERGHRQEQRDGVAANARVLANGLGRPRSFHRTPGTARVRTVENPASNPRRRPESPRRCGRRSTSSGTPRRRGAAAA